MKEQKNNFMIGGSLQCEEYIKGHRIWKVENHCSRVFKEK